MSGEAVKVVVRCRPMNQREKDLKCDVIVNIETTKSQVQLKCLEEPNLPPKSFTFDGSYGTDSHTETIYNDVGFPLVESVCEGYNGTVFAYGQTGCGKSFSMQGNQLQKGIIPRAFEHIFEAVATDTTKKYLIRASYLEIYNENVRDLLGKEYKQTLDLHEHPDKGIYIPGLSWNECKKVTDCEKLMDKGNKNRSTGATLMNADSSRSHSIFTINVEMCEKDNEGEEHYRVGKLNLVDLAGSERQSKTGATGDRLKEATKINLSLSALGNVISALVDGKSKHIPYRDSKLTRLLQDSLGGNTKTLMIAAVSPAADNYEETLSTLRYANRAKNIKNKPTINEDPKDAMLRQLQDEINILKAQLAGKVPIPPSQASNNNSKITLLQIEEEKRKLREEFEEQINEIKKQYEEEKMSKEALLKTMEQIKEQYDSQLVLLEDGNENYVEVGDFITDQQVANDENPITKSTNAVQQTINGKRTGKVILGIKKESDLRRSSAAIKRIMDEFPLQKQQQIQHQILQQQKLNPQQQSNSQLAQQQILQQQQLTPQQQLLQQPNVSLDLDIDNENGEFRSETSDPAQRLLQLQEMVVGGEQANNEELKKKRIKKKKYAEERKRLLAESLRNGDDEEFMLRVYDSVQEEVQFKTKLFDKEKEKCKFLENEVKDLQSEFELEREDLLDTIRKNEKQIKLIVKILQKIQPIIPQDSNYYNLDKIQTLSIWNEEIQDWIVPDYKREKLSLPTFNNNNGSIGNESNDTEPSAIGSANSKNGIEYDYDPQQYANHQVMSQQQSLLNSRRTTTLLSETSSLRAGALVNGTNGYAQANLREPEIDRYRIKLENSQFNGSNYFKTKRQSELLGQTQDIRTNGRLSPLSNNSNGSESRNNRRF